MLHNTDTANAMLRSGKNRKGKNSNMADVRFSKPKVVIISRKLRYIDEICFVYRFWTSEESVTTLNTKPEVVWSRRGRHLVYDVITPPQVARFGRNLGIQNSVQITVNWSKSQREEFQPSYWKSFFAVFAGVFLLLNVNCMTELNTRAFYYFRHIVRSIQTANHSSWYY